MNKCIFEFLKEYNVDEVAINRLLVSSFVYHQNIAPVKNQLISDLIINKGELEYVVLEGFLELLLKTNRCFGFEELLEVFELVISPSDKLINGAIYTPENIRKYITNQSFSSLKRKSFAQIKVADIACGCGGFLIDASIKIKELTGKSFQSIFKENIFGVDIQAYSVERTSILLSLLAIVNGEDALKFRFNLYTENSLEFDWIKEDKSIKRNKGFDLILGNPPYVCARNLDEATKELMGCWEVCNIGNPDLYIPFFQVGYELLTRKGVLGFITVNSFISSVNGRGIRKYFQENEVLLKIIDFVDEQIFKSRSTYTCLCFIEKLPSSYVYYLEMSEASLVNIEQVRFKQNSYLNLDSEKGWRLKDYELITKIESIGTPFGELFDTKSGIATLKNNVFFFNPVKESTKYWYIDESVKVEKEICKDIVNTNQLNTHSSLDLIKQKLIFPYFHDENNHAVLIPEAQLIKRFPFAYQYLKSQKGILDTRDKGKGKYSAWYAYGRTQSLEKRKYKLFFPHLIKSGFNSVMSEDQDLYFFNGMAAYSDDKTYLLILQKLLMTNVFWSYIVNSSKPYSSGYFGLGRNYLKNFSIPDFSSDEIELLLGIECIDELNEFVQNKYQLC